MLNEYLDREFRTILGSSMPILAFDIGILDGLEPYSPIAWAGMIRKSCARRRHHAKMGLSFAMGAWRAWHAGCTLQRVLQGGSIVFNRNSELQA